MSKKAQTLIADEEINYCSEDVEGVKNMFDKEKITFKDYINSKTKFVKEWCSNHKEELIGCAVLIAPLLIGKVTGKNSADMRDTKNMVRKSLYDNEAGHYWTLKKSPTNKQWAEIDRRHFNNEHLCDILDDMKLLK